MEVTVFLIIACFHVTVLCGSIEQSQYVPCSVSRNVTSGTDQHFSSCTISGKSFAFVLQTTSSMSNELRALKDTLRNVNVNTLSTECYTLVVFDDTGVTTVYYGESLSDLLSLLDKLTYKTSSTPRSVCIVSAIKAASLFLSPGSRILVQTDSAPSDLEKNDRVTALLQEKRIVVDFLVTRTYQQSVGLYGKRNRSVSSWFLDLAQLSGGTVLEGDKEDIDELTAVIGVSVSNSAAVSLLKAVVPAGNGREVSVCVDSSLLEITVSVVGNITTPSLVTYTPNGMAHVSSDIVVSVNRNLVYRVQNPQPGTWRIQLTDSQAYDMEVSGKSSMDFSYQFVSERNGVLLPIEGRPMAGFNTTVIIQMTEEENLDRLEQVVLFDKAGTEIMESTLESRTGISGTKYSATLLLSSQSFRIGVKGTDRNNFTLQRIDMAWIQPQFVSLATLPGTQGQLFPGSQITVPVLIKNHGDLNVFRMNVSDDVGLVFEVVPASVSLSSGENTTVLVTFVAPVNTPVGMTSITTLLVSGDDGSFNSIVLRISVEARSTNVPDFEPPSCIIQYIAKNCTLEQQHLPVCGGYSWSASVDVYDDDSGIFRLTISPDDRGVLAYEDFPEGISKTTINATYRSSCCHPAVTITVSDMGGNIGQCVIDFYIPFPTTTSRPTTAPMSTDPKTEGQLTSTTPHATLNNDAADIASIVLGSILGIVVLTLIILYAAVSLSVTWYRRRGQKKVAQARVTELDMG